MSPFDGFGPDTVIFLSELSANNNKAWFDSHRSEYETSYIAPAKAFVGAVGAGLQAIAPGIHAEPKVNGSIFRINRDIRFSRDKTPSSLPVFRACKIDGTATYGCHCRNGTGFRQSADGLQRI